MRARTAAAHVDRSDGRFVEYDRGRARAEARVVRMADPDAFHIGDEIAHA